MAHKKGQGSSRNGRDSNPRCSGIKLYGDSRPSREASSAARRARSGVPARTSAWAATGQSSPHRRDGSAFDQNGRRINVVPAAKPASQN